MADADKEYLEQIDARLTLIERSMGGVEEQIAFLIARGVNQNELKFPGDESEPFRYTSGNGGHSFRN